MQKTANVLAIGAGIEQVFSIKTARDLGLNVIAVDREKNSPGFAYTSQHYAVDIKDANAVLEVAKKHDIKAVIPACIGRFITSVGYINEQLGLTGPMLRACECCADKALFHKMMVSSSLHVPRQFSIQKHAQINNVPIPPPIIAKPRYGSGSKGVKLITNQVELDDYMESFGDNLILGEPLIEEFIEGIEYGIDAIVMDGKVVFLNLRDKVMTPLPYRQELRYISPSSDNTPYNCILAAISHVVKVLNIQDTMLHADIIIDNNGQPYIIEMSPRPAGLNIISKILLANTGRNLIAEWIKYQVWKHPIEPIVMNNIVCLQYFPFENIYVSKIFDIDTITKKYNITAIDFRISAGDNLNNIHDGNDLAHRGHFMITDNSYNNIKQRSENILNEVRRNLYE